MVRYVVVYVVVSDPGTLPLCSRPGKANTRHMSLQYTVELLQTVVEILDYAGKIITSVVKIHQPPPHCPVPQQLQVKEYYFILFHHRLYTCKVCPSSTVSCHVTVA